MAQGSVYSQTANQKELSLKKREGLYLFVGQIVMSSS